VGYFLPDRLLATKLQSFNIAIERVTNGNILIRN
jgi:hypothetical protein